MMSRFKRGLDPNILRGIVPTAGSWGTAPDNLANCTDGDLSTATGTGSTNAAGEGNYGTLTFDLGSTKTLLLSCRVGLWSSASYVVVTFDSSDDNVNWRYSGINGASIVSVGEQVVDCVPGFVTGRYIRIRFYVGGIATANAKIYEVMGYEHRIT